jgi:L-serine dehydratase
MAVRHDRKVSILDVMGPVMVGPSSSHTAGTARLGRVAYEILDDDPKAVHFFLHPPLAATYRGHGSDFALVGGSIGLNVDDPRIPEAIRIAEQMGVEIEFSEEDQGMSIPIRSGSRSRGGSARSRSWVRRSAGE